MSLNEVGTAREGAGSFHPVRQSARLLDATHDWALNGGWGRSFVVATLGMGLATLALLSIKGLLGPGDTALLILPVIVGVAAVGGVRAGVLGALLGFFVAKYFFFPAYYSLHSDDPRDWTSLVVFELIGLAMGTQTTRTQQRQVDLGAREREASILYRLSRELATEESPEGVCRRVISTLAGIVPDGRSEIVLATTSTLPQRAARSTPGDVPPRAADPSGSVPTTRASEDVYGEQRGDTWTTTLATEREEGTLNITGARPGRRERRLCAAVAQLAATHLARIRLRALATRAEAVHETERLKSNLVSSVSHELKTPLAIVTAIVTNLLEADLEWTPGTVHAELEVAANALELLNASIGDLLDLSRLESGNWMPAFDWYDVDDILGTVIDKVPRIWQSRVQLAVATGAPMVYVDFVQWVRMLGHIVENALIYGGDDTPVTIRVYRTNNALVFSVEDQGPGVAPEEADQIFGKFYRGRLSAIAPGGTGLGLAIAREIVEFHGGRIWSETISEVTGNPRPGARFTVTLPNSACRGATDTLEEEE